MSYYMIRVKCSWENRLQSTKILNYLNITKNSATKKKNRKYW